MSEPLVVVGNGMVAARFVEELSTRALGRYSILVVGEEPRPAYNRVLLSSLLADEIADADLELKPAAWWRAKGVSTLFGRAVTAVDRGAKTVALSDGRTLPYGKLVLATGSRPIRLPKPGMDLPGVISFRDVADVDAMRAAARRGCRAVVIGGGLLGLEAAYGLAKAGAPVTLIHIMDRLMERQLDAPAAALLADAMRRNGVEIVLQADTARVMGSDRAEGVELTDGRVLPADLVVCAVGVRPNADLARAAGLDVGRGVLVNDGLITSDPAIHAIGECAEHRGACYGLVEPGYEMAAALARRFSGDAWAAYPGSVLSTNLKVSGVPVFSAGDFSGGEGTQDLVFSDAAAGVYRRLVLKGSALIGAVLVGDAADALWYRDLIRSGESVAALRHSLVFGRAFCPSAEPLPKAA